MMHREGGLSPSSSGSCLPEACRAFLSRTFVLVTGATGAVGPALVDLLLSVGARVRILARTPARWSGDRVEVGVGDIREFTTVADGVAGVDAVVHLAGVTEERVGNDPGLYETTNVLGTRNVVEAARRAGVGRLVLLSSISVYGPSENVCHTERSEPRPNSEYGRSKLRAEGVALPALTDRGQPLTAVLRAAAVYGPNMRGNYLRLTRGLARRRFVPVGSGANQRTVVHESDVAAAAVLALWHPAAAGKIYNVTDGSVHTVRKIIDAICSALGRTPPRFSIPLGLASGAVWLASAMRQHRGASGTWSAESLRRYTENLAVEGALVQRELGYSPRYDLDSGWRHTVAALRFQGDLPRTRRSHGSPPTISP